MKKNLLAISLLSAALLLSACTSPAAKTTDVPKAAETVTEAVFTAAATEITSTQSPSTQTEAPKKAEYKSLTPQEAKARMDSGDELIILDVREDSEFAQGHVPGALLLPLGQIKAKAEVTLYDKDEEILLYCRSGNRSRQAALILLDLGYTNVYDFGGIVSWPYDVVK